MTDATTKTTPELEAPTPRRVLHPTLEKMEQEKVQPSIPLSRSFYQNLYELASRSPGAAISSICALFITLILAITLPLFFSRPSSC